MMTEKRNSAGKQEQKTPLTTLIVEDDADQAILLKLLLKKDSKYQHEIHIAKNLKEALQQLDAIEFGLILSDLNLPDSQGGETMQAIHKFCPATPIIVITSVNDDKTEFLTISAGAQDYIIKGETDDSNILRIIYRSLQRHAQLQDVELQRDQLAHRMQGIPNETPNAVDTPHNTPGLWKLQDDTILDQNETLLQKLEYLAHFDTLTQIPNRYSFEHTLEKTLASGERYNRRFAVMFLDIDHFKLINDTFGHHIGDLLLKETVSRIAPCLRKDDTFARLGGDEFGIITPEIDNFDALSIIAEKIIATLEEKFTIEGKEFHISTSIGIACYPDASLTAQGLMKNADVALYLVKQSGRNGYQFFQKDIDIIQKRRRLIEKELHFALERNELYLVYQPKIDLKTKKTLGLEVLLRWTNQELGEIPPNEFIPIAEASGLILPLGDWVIEEACKQQQIWIKNKMGPYPIAINFSARQLMQRNLVNYLKEKLLYYKIPPGFFQVELTETALMDSEWEHKEMFNELYSFGIHLSIDDFGTGYSSFERLKSLPIQSIKIDISFIKRVTLSQQDAIIVKSIISLAKGLNLITIAEGVETKEQAEFLSSEGCDQVQGFYYSKPLVASDWEEIVKNHTEFDLSSPEDYGSQSCKELRMIAHDMNNVLASIKGYAELSIRNQDNNKPLQQIFTKIEVQADTLASVMKAISIDIQTIQQKDKSLDADDILNISQIAHYSAHECDTVFKQIESLIQESKQHISNMDAFDKNINSIQRLVGDGMIVATKFRNFLANASPNS